MTPIHSHHSHCIPTRLGMPKLHTSLVLLFHSHHSHQNNIAIGESLEFHASTLLERSSRNSFCCSRALRGMQKNGGNGGNARYPQRNQRLLITTCIPTILTT